MAPNTAPDTKRARELAPVTEDEAAAFWWAFDAKAAPRVRTYEQAARQRFAEERAGVLATLRAAVPKSATPPTVERKDDPGMTAEDREAAERAIRAAWEAPYVEAAVASILADYAVDGPYAQAWAEEFRVLLTATMQTAAGEFVRQAAGVGVTFGMDNPALIRAIEERAAALVQNVLQTTKDVIAETIARGRAEGLTIEQIAARVDERAFGASARARARAIAATEVVGAINTAEWTAATESGVFRSKRWIHTRRPGDRDYHDAHEYEGPDGGWVPIDYEYVAQNGFRFPRPFAPGLAASEVVNCGCTLAYSDVDPAQAREEQGEAS